MQKYRKKTKLLAISTENITFALNIADDQMQRVNWIDWAKTMAVCSVVFCHLPQSQEWFYYRYLQAVTISIFFFISGFLKKDHGNHQANWKKYWHGLILPYMLYNAIVYPYWLLRYYLQYHGMPDATEALKPIIGTLLFEHQGPFAEPLNGSLWYLPAILFMHIIIDLCQKTRYLHQIMIGLCIISYFLYVANKQWEFMHSLTPMGIFRRLPYYYLGYVIGQKQLYRSIHQKREVIGLGIGLITSILLFDWHLHEDNLWLHTIFFYPLNLGALWGVLSLCRLLDSYKLTPIINLSVGTLVIIGLHSIVIGGINFGVEHYLGQVGAVCYHWYEAFPTTLIIITLLYPVIIFGKKQAPILLGKDKNYGNGTGQKQ